MNYRHSYHAGNFADVFKHIVLIALTKSFLRKENAFCYLDTHAGIGLYDLMSVETQKTKEYETGISKVLAQKNPPDLIKEYIEIVRSTKNEFSYPGSPLFVKNYLRKQDRMILSELHPEDCAILKKHFAHDKQVAVHCQDGYQSLKAFLPPKEKRGFVLIDPPYEKADEFEQLLKIIPETVKRWETGTFVLWYPIKNRATTDRFIRSLKTKITRPILITELSIYPEDNTQQLNGSGMLIINPPWLLNEELQPTLPWLRETLSTNKRIF